MDLSTYGSATYFGHRSGENASEIKLKKNKRGKKVPHRDLTIITNENSFSVKHLILALFLISSCIFLYFCMHLAIFFCFLFILVVLLSLLLIFFFWGGGVLTPHPAPCTLRFRNTLFKQRKCSWPNELNTGLRRRRAEFDTLSFFCFLFNYLKDSIFTN